MGDDSLEARVHARAARLSKSQRRVAEFVTSQENNAALLTAADVAAAVGVSEATVVRFAQALGFDGYPSLRRSMQQTLVHNMTTVNRLKSTLQEKTDAPVLERFLAEDADAVQRTARTIQRDQFEAAVDMLLNSRSLHIVGHLMAYPAAHLLWMGCRMIGLPAHLIEASGADTAVHLQGTGRKDLLVSISLLRYNVATVGAVRTAGECGMRRLAITDDLLSPTAVHSDVSLVIASTPEHFFQSTTAVTSVVNGLVTACSIKRPSQAQRALAELERRWQESHTFYED